MGIIEMRRSIRNFDIDKKVEDQTLIELVKAGMLAPSARNEQPWEFIIVNERTILDEMMLGLPNGKMLQEARAAIIVLGNKNRYKTMFYQCDLGACTQNILLKATELGVGTCWIGCKDNEPRGEHLRQMFNLAEDIEVYAVIAVGYPKNEADIREVVRFSSDLIHFNRW